MTEIMIDVAKEFSTYPSGRVDADGDYNGTRFRERFLLPALKAAQADGTRVIVDIDGVRTFGSSFIEEAFGGLVRTGVVTAKQLPRVLAIRCTKDHLELFRDSIERHLRAAHTKSG